MKFSQICLLSFVFCFPTFLNAQQHNTINNRTSPCIQPAQREQINHNIKNNRALLGLTPKQSKAISDLAFPLKLKEPIPGYNHFYLISAYVDHDNTSGIRDYNCQNLTYNTHKGTDFATWPFPWYLYEEDLVHVVSAYEGTIVLKDDGQPDQNCTHTGTWNAVYIEHSDGSIIWYGHMKKGSLTSKKVGETVTKGEYLGVVASSGWSNGPHLHMEYYDKNGKLIDPYKGACNSLNSTSMWTAQRKHTNTKIAAVLTHSAPPNLNCGVQVEVAALSNTFNPDQTVYYGIYLNNYKAGDTAVAKLFDPNDSLYNTFILHNKSNNYGWFYKYENIYLRDTDRKGTWKVECTFNDTTVSHSFEYEEVVTNIQELNKTVLVLYPNPTCDFISLQGEGIEHYETYSIIDISGQKVCSGQLNDDAINVQMLSNGLYYLMVENDSYYNPPIKFTKH